MAFKETRPLHPPPRSRNSNPNRECQDDPSRRVSARLLPPWIASDEPPRRAPQHPGKDASFHRAETGAAANRPSHGAQSRKEQCGKDKIVRQVASVVVAHG